LLDRRSRKVGSLTKVRISLELFDRGSFLLSHGRQLFLLPKGASRFFLRLRLATNLTFLRRLLPCPSSFVTSRHLIPPVYWVGGRKFIKDQSLGGKLTPVTCVSAPAGFSRNRPGRHTRMPLH